ncbi:uncharacterized protein I303_105166 [Kwoniella dejecticola CBS 10117]|uniref:Uncharacterized protein n=1 Tax=Kwoniella dejecticola CBS 10117 TaxID=1296121 RepID=A0A1A6A3A5_9TREE|nr:uncharacterized protein I303_05388 [Kwoniella dejecticola CBS 10117]OBR84529.1 hypothetical protein I303_05388 [Kwoniella dejecticola CBS 10117]
MYQRFFDDASDSSYSSAEIREALDEGRMVIRLTDSSSRVSLENAGFTATHPRLQPSPTNKEWKDKFQVLRSTKRRILLTGRSYINITLIRRTRKYAPTYKGTKALYVSPIEYIENYQNNYRDRLSNTDVNAARNFANASSEILYYGKIFNKDILETTTWTHDDMPFDLPQYCLKPRKYWTNHWLDNLVWDPRNDSFWEADGKMQDRNDQIIRSQQPRRY